MLRPLLVLSLILFFSLPAAAAVGKSCRPDGAVYKPQGRHHLGDGDYELVLEDLHPATPGGAYVRLHLNLYEPRSHKLMTTAALTANCIGTGLCQCRVTIAGIREPIDIMLLNKDLSFAGEDLLTAAPYAILLPHITEKFYYGVHVGDKNPDVKYLSDPPATVALPPQIWIRETCGKPSKHFGHVN
jgi:hypothetical protein